MELCEIILTIINHHVFFWAKAQARPETALVAPSETERREGYEIMWNRIHHHKPPGVLWKQRRPGKFLRMRRICEDFGVRRCRPAGA